jgi:hypothetical protein
MLNELSVLDSVGAIDKDTWFLLDSFHCFDPCPVDLIKVLRVLLIILSDVLRSENVVKIEPLSLKLLPLLKGVKDHIKPLLPLFSLYLESLYVPGANDV